MINGIRGRAMKEWRSFSESKEPVILVGAATCGRASGAIAVIDALEKEITGRGIAARIVQVGCIGLCYKEPLVDIVKPGRPRVSFGNITPKQVPRLLNDYMVHDTPPSDLAIGTFGEDNLDGIPRFFDHPMLKPQVRIVLKNCGFIDPESIDHYIARDGYAALEKALTMTPEEIIGEITRAGLRGRGGAGFPSGKKWEMCRKAGADEKYLICNGDEGDPGAFMNRSLIEGDPHALLEGMLIAGYAIGAKRGYIYIRAEYPLAIERLKIGLKQMEEYGLIGKDILGSGFGFTIEIKEGAGAFVCGEETALMASIEGRRGMPRSRPPYPAVSGLFGKPTVINNVETLGTVPTIIRRGAGWYTGYGTGGSKGTKTFSLVGKMERTGLIEVPMGTTMKEIIYDIGGGIYKGKKFKALQTGGPSGGCLPSSLVDLPIDYESLTSAGSIMGSGGMIVMDEETCVVDVARYFLDFTQKESCGKCVPCRIGTRQMLDILKRITEGKGDERDIALLEELGSTVKQTSLCGLGQTAPNPVLTTLRYFRSEYEAHIKEKRCPALVCKDLIRYDILPDKCVGCLICMKQCPAVAISGELKKVHVIDTAKCTKCGICLEVCPAKIGAVVKVSGDGREAGHPPEVGRVGGGGSSQGGNTEARTASIHHAHPDH